MDERAVRAMATLSVGQNVSEDEQKWISRLYNFQMDMDIYLSPILIVFGFAGNITSVVVVRSKYFRRCPCAVLLSCLAMVDTGVLLTGLLRIWIMSAFDIDIRTLSTASCRVHYFLTYLLQHLSSWTVVMVTMERLVSVFKPMKAKVLCSQKHLVKWMGTLVVGLVAINGHVLFMLNIHEDVYPDMEVNNFTKGLGCKFVEEDYFGYHVWPWIDYAILAFFPFIILAVGNTMIAVKVIKKRRSRTFGLQYRHSKEREQKVASMTGMLFSVTVMFFLTTTPIEVYLIGFNYWDITTPRGYAQTLTAFVICSLWFYVNNATNFLLYCVSGSRFRKALRSLHTKKMVDITQVNTWPLEERMLSPWLRDKRMSRLASWY